MPAGPGKYDQECSAILGQTEASLILLLVIQGYKGNGFSVTATNWDQISYLPELLRDAADQIECDINQS
jgi:hypothetical protein